MGKTIALVCFLASTAGAYDLKGVGPGADVAVARSAGLECLYSKCRGGLDLLTFGGMVEANYTETGTVTDVTFDAMPHRYTELRAALVAKYGKPKSSGVVVKQNNFGAKIDSHVDLWEADGQTMLLDEYAELASMTLTIRQAEPKRVNAGI